jgi:hypothetical protein
MTVNLVYREKYQKRENMGKKRWRKVEKAWWWKFNNGVTGFKNR